MTKKKIKTTLLWLFKYYNPERLEETDAKGIEFAGVLLGFVLGMMVCSMVSAIIVFEAIGYGGFILFIPALLLCFVPGRLAADVVVTIVGAVAKYLYNLYRDLPDDDEELNRRKNKSDKSTV